LELDDSHVTKYVFFKSRRWTTDILAVSQQPIDCLISAKFCATKQHILNRRDSRVSPNVRGFGEPSCGFVVLSLIQLLVFLTSETVVSRRLLTVHWLTVAVHDGKCHNNRGLHRSTSHVVGKSVTKLLVCLFEIKLSDWQDGSIV